MDVVEVCYRSRHHKELPHQALQFLPSQPSLRVRDGEQLEELQVFLFWKGNCARLHVNLPPQHLIFSGPVALACHQLLDADGILGFSRQGQKKAL